MEVSNAYPMVMGFVFLLFVSLEQAHADATEVIQKTEKNKQNATEKEAEVREAYATLKAKLETVGNLIHDSVQVDKDEVSSISPSLKVGLHCGDQKGDRFMSVWSFHLQANNLVTKTYAEAERRVASPGQKLKNHVDLVEECDLADIKRGSIG